MGFAKVHSGQTRFLAGQIIDIEIDLSKGLHAFSIVGLPDKAIEESRDRISSAIKNSGFKSPKAKNQKVVISLAPADVRKAGPAFDAAMAIGYLLAAEEINFEPRGKVFLGELSLDGRLRSITGAFAIVNEAKKLGFKEVFIPEENAAEATLIGDVKIFAAKNLAEIIDYLTGKNKAKNISMAATIAPLAMPATPSPLTLLATSSNTDIALLDEIKGQESAKRALEIAAAGGHNILLIGPPGTGKTMLAKALKALLPPLSQNEAMEVMQIQSVNGTFANRAAAFLERPFRSPHHTSSYVSIIGGSGMPRPGEMTLAHHGVLFLDEFPEFDRRVIESLREPLEERMVSISRIGGRVTFPANFMLVAAMNPCPCGGKKCVCGLKEIARYKKKISGPILDRIDLRVTVGNVDFEKFATTESNKNVDMSTNSAKIQKRILAARNLQAVRLENLPLKTNANIGAKDLPQLAPIEEAAHEALINSAAKFNLSMRAFHRIWRVARTVADLEKEPLIKTQHVLEALQFRGEEES